MLEKKDIEFLKISKNLLAFSGGADSTALFFLLKKYDIHFDIAIVDYNIREQSKEEVLYAKELAKKYNKICFVMQAKKIYKNFEAQARVIRYDFFHYLIQKHSYTVLLTAHHLGDRLEWFLMQLSKGAGYFELNSLKKIINYDTHVLLRPLLHVTKNELTIYLKNNNYKWFEDVTNQNMVIKRNEFRHLYAEPLLKKYTNGIKKSFEYMDKDTNNMIETIQVIKIQKLYYFKKTNNNIYHIDKILKKLGIIISHHVRTEIENSKEIIISRRYVVAKIKRYIFIAPFIKNIKIDKKFKEECRLLNIAPKLRPYLFKHQNIFTILKQNLYDKFA